MYKLLSLVCLLPLTAWGQTSLDDIRVTPEKAGGVYYAYPVTESMNTPAPAGYEPFYISHYGRHGSRYLISDNDYKWVLEVFQNANEQNALTPLGADVMERLAVVYDEGQGRGGELTPLGTRQHQGIATRMYQSFPTVFQGNPVITAASTPVMRCAHSMFAFIEGLKQQNPSLVIPRESAERNLNYLNYHSQESGKYTSNKAPWYQEYKKFEAEKTNPERIIGTLFNDSTFVRRYVDQAKLMQGLYWIAVDMQNMETPVSFMDLFTPEELYDLWQIYNFNFYATNSSYPLADGQHVDNAKNLLTNILQTADEYISEGKNGATLRFGHDGNIIPLAALMQFPNCAAYEANPYKLSQVYSNYEISPMASNVQMIFYHGEDPNDIIVKFMLNEREISIPATTDMFPFYRWEDARKTLKKILDTPCREYIPQIN